MSKQDRKKYDPVFLEEMPPINKAEMIALLATFTSLYVENVFGIPRETSRRGIYDSTKEYVLSGMPENHLKERGIGRPKPKRPKTTSNLKIEKNGK